MRISGVNVRKVKKIDLSEDGRTDAEIELDDKYAPIPQDSLSDPQAEDAVGRDLHRTHPGSTTASDIPEGGRLVTAQVAPTVELDEILRAFDKPTREAFQVWQQDLGKGIEGQGAGFSEFLGVLPAFAEDTNTVVKILNSQERAVREDQNTGVVFDALTERGDQLAQWIDNSNRLLSTTARRDDSIRALFQAFPTFIDESNTTLRALGAYAENTEPLMRQLKPVGTQLSNFLMQASAISNDFNEFFIGLNRVIPASVEGLPASSRFLDDTRNLFAQLDPVLRNWPVLRVPLALQARDRRDARKHHSGHPGDRPDRRGQGPLPAAHEPAQPGGARHLPAAPGLAPRRPYLKPGGFDQIGEGFRCSTRISASRTASRRSARPRPACPRSFTSGSCCTRSTAATRSLRPATSKARSRSAAAPPTTPRSPRPRPSRSDADRFAGRRVRAC